MNAKKNKVGKRRISNLFKLTGMLKPFRARMALAIISGIGHQFFVAAVAAMGAVLVGYAIEGTLLSNWQWLMTVFVGLIIMRILFYFLEMWFAHDVAFKVLANFRIELFNAIEKVSPSIILNMRLGQLASTAMSDVELLEWFFAHSFGSVIVATVVTTIFTVLLASIWWGFVPMVIVFIALAILIPERMKQRADIQGAAVRDTLGEANAVTMEGVHGLKEILTLNSSMAYLEKNRKYMDKLYEGQLGYGQRLGTEGALLQGNMGLSMLFIAFAASSLSAAGRLDVSMYPAIVVLAAMVLGPVTEICSTARNFGLIFAASERVYNILEQKPLVEDNGREIDTASLEPKITFKNVAFSYGTAEESVFRNLNIEVKAGEKVAIAGESGIGKSTCLKLLMRYYDPAEGAIYIGDCDIRDMSLSSLYKMVSVVLQDVYLFHESIRENIRLGRPDATDQQVEDAAKMANAHEFIIELPEGYDTVAGEAGLKLSGGQKQRIAIARALLKDTPILPLDEAVSNLDAANEKSIQLAIENSCKEKTIIMVAHRQSTLDSADRIIRLE